MTGGAGGYSGSGYSRGGAAAPPARSFEERAQAKEQMMASVRESSQQERRVYVGNLSYDVKWHHLKDFMRQGKEASYDSVQNIRTGQPLTRPLSWGSAFCRCVVASEWNVEGGRLRVKAVVFLVLFWLMDVGLTDWAIVRGLCRDAGELSSEPARRRHD